MTSCLSMSRRRFLAASATALAAGAASTCAADDEPLRIVDTHQHLWDLEKFRLPWLTKDSPLDKSYVTADYLAAAKGLNVVKAVYMEVDVAPEQHVAEAEYVLALCEDAKNVTVAGVIGGRPASEDFADYLGRFKKDPRIHGIRQVKNAAKAGELIDKSFVRGVRLLGEHGKSFDICIPPTLLGEAARLVDACPDTRFILDHCGNGDPFAFMKSPPPGVKPAHAVDDFRRDIAALAKRDRVICKISGIVARMAGHKWTPDQLAPVVNICLDAFGPDRVIFASDWPVCTLAAGFEQWVNALKAIVAARPRADQQKLFAENAERYYKI